MLVRRAGILTATPLLAVVVAIEAADLIFAVDSVPAVLAVSDNLFVVYTSNAMAILGLRALYFCLSGLLSRFHLLSKGLALILAFIGVKLLLQATAHYVPGVPTIPTAVSLGVIVATLAAAIALSLVVAPKQSSPSALPTQAEVPEDVDQSDDPKEVVRI
jgi:tellurite resistance protein TerC